MKAKEWSEMVEFGRRDYVGGRLNCWGVEIVLGADRVAGK
jgi:hypothetical protein